jgi:hypothetical protein
LGAGKQGCQWGSTNFCGRVIELQYGWENSEKKRLGDTELRWSFLFDS